MKHTFFALLIVLFFSPLVHAADPAAAASPVAIVNGEPITKAEFNEQFKIAKEIGQPIRDHDLRKLVLTQMIENKLVLQAAQGEDIKNDPEYKLRLDHAKDRIQQEVYLYRRAQQKLDTNILKDLYSKFVAENKNREEVWAKHILLKDKETARSIIKRLDNGEKFEKLAEEYSIDKTGKVGGDLGYFSRGVMIPEFEYTAFSLDKDAYTKEPIQTRFGWHVIKTINKRKINLPSFEELKPQLTAKATRNIIEQIVADLRDNAKVEIKQ